MVRAEGCQPKLHEADDSNPQCFSMVAGIDMRIERKVRTPSRLRRQYAIAASASQSESANDGAEIGVLAASVALGIGKGSLTARREILKLYVRLCCIETSSVPENARIVPSAGRARCPSLWLAR